MYNLRIMGLEDRLKAVQPEPAPLKIIVQSKAPVRIPTNLLPRFDDAEQEAKLRDLAQSANATTQLQTLLAFVQNEGLCRGWEVDSGTFFSPSRMMPWIDSAALEIRTLPSSTEEGLAPNPVFGVVFQAAPPGLAFDNGETLSMLSYLDLSAQRHPLYARVRDAIPAGQNSRAHRSLENNTMILSHTFSDPNNLNPATPVENLVDLYQDVKSTTLEDDLVVLYRDGLLGKKRRFYYGYFEPKSESVKDPNLKLVQFQDYRRINEPSGHTHRPYVTDPTKGQPASLEGTEYTYWNEEFVPSLNLQRGLYNEIVKGDLSLRGVPGTGSNETLSPSQLMVLSQQPPIIDNPEELTIRDKLVQAFNEYGVSRRMDVLLGLITSSSDPERAKLYYSINPYLNLYFLNYLYTQHLGGSEMERVYWELPGVAQEPRWVQSKETGRRIVTNHGSKQFLISLAVPIVSEKTLPPQIHIKSIKDTGKIATPSQITTATVFQPEEGEGEIAITELDDQVFYLIQKFNPAVLKGKFKQLSAEEKKRLVDTYPSSKNALRPPKPQWMVDKENEVRIQELKSFLTETLSRADAVGLLKELQQRWGEVGHVNSYAFGTPPGFGSRSQEVGYRTYWSYAFPTSKVAEAHGDRVNYAIGLTISAEMASFRDSPDTASIIISYRHGLGSETAGSTRRKLPLSKLIGDGKEQLQEITLDLIEDLEKAKTAPYDLYRKNSIWWRRLLGRDNN